VAQRDRLFINSMEKHEEIKAVANGVCPISGVGNHVFQASTVVFFFFYLGRAITALHSLHYQK
jgi:hypothetical protein